MQLKTNILQALRKDTISGKLNLAPTKENLFPEAIFQLECEVIGYKKQTTLSQSESEWVADCESDIETLKNNL